ncbi:hypothetical protein [Paenibacillus sp. V4I7]|uniref:hypothetical protein n=1 Tax=Paenibacillus sp. V4I7 TaxID=3042307 RepID=UPI00277DB4A0|nr:hypothetical protein [Paenibacillus sp. V4I7]MDQ0897487.1 hypothetical protein [Paenibacillus sp. V4I7]
MMALALAPRGVLLKIQFLRPITKGLMDRSLLNPKFRITERAVNQTVCDRAKELVFRKYTAWREG